MKTHFLFSIFLVFSFLHLFSQDIATTDTANLPHGNIVNGELSGIVLDKNTREPLLYTNIYVLHKDRGTITNENGRFSLDVSGLDNNDTLRFQYIGYQTKNITLGMLDTMFAVYMQEASYDLLEAVVFGGAPDPKFIVKNVVKNIDSNYYTTSSVWETFIRERNLVDVNTLEFDYKKGTIEDLGEDVITKLEQKIPKHTTGYTDFLGNLYFSNNVDDTLKVDPIRVVELKEKDMSDLKQIERIFNKMLANTKDDEYWKVRTGIFSSKVDFENKDKTANMDTTSNKRPQLKYYSSGFIEDMKYPFLKDKDDWEFLYKTGKYNYTLVGGVRVNGEDIYIIDFEPHSSGVFTGRMYVSSSTYALIRADYEYAPEKRGTDIHMFGIGYSENNFFGSIYFEKKNDKYVLKYFSKMLGTDIEFDRNLTLMKKRKRFLFDKTLNEIKIGLKLSIYSESSTEILVLDTKDISQKDYNDFKQQKYLDIIYVDQFDDNLWKGYSIIEPTKRMKEYKKQKE